MEPLQTLRLNMSFPILALPIPLPQNATLYFESSASGIEIDPATGNEVAATEIVEVPASLRDQRARPRDQNYTVLNERAIALRGFLLGDPAVYSDLDFSQTVKCRLIAPNGTDVTGELSFKQVPTPFDTAVLASAGTPIEGTLKLVGSGESF